MHDLPTILTVMQLMSFVVVQNKDILCFNKHAAHFDVTKH